MSYKSYLHVEKLESPEVEGILDYPCTLSSKIDGTNFCVWSENGQIHAGSRKRELSDEKDNAQSYYWITKSDDEEAILLREFVLNHPNLIVYGEWMGSTKFVGAIKDYTNDSLQKMYIFDMYDKDKKEYLLEKEWRDFIKDTKLEKYTTEFYGEFKDLTPDKIKEIAEHNHYLLPASMVGEGIVIKPATNWRNKFGRQAYAKYVREAFKEQKSSPKKKKESITNIEEYIITEYLTNSEMMKNKSKVEVKFDSQFDNKNNKHIAMFINLCFYDSVLDSIKSIVKKEKNAIINFSTLKQLSDKKARSFLDL